MSEDVRTGIADFDDGEIERGETGIRILLTLLFVMVAAAIEAVLAVVVVFELAWTLITRQPPNDWVRDLANRVIAYYYRIGRYLTYNDSHVPFPFSPFPPALEDDGFDPDVRESDAIGLPRSGSDEELDDERP